MGYIKNTFYSVFEAELFKVLSNVSSFNPVWSSSVDAFHTCMMTSQCQMNVTRHAHLKHSYEPELSYFNEIIPSLSAVIISFKVYILKLPHEIQKKINSGNPCSTCGTTFSAFIDRLYTLNAQLSNEDVIATQLKKGIRQTTHGSIMIGWSHIE